jgi:gliding motility-associated-like protein
METPVTEEGWTSIVNDSRYARKFARKPGLSPKGRAALIAGVATVLVAVPILVKTLTNKPEETAQTTVPTTETAVEQKATETATPQDATKTATYQSATGASSTTTPAASETAKVTTTEKAATHEGNTMGSVIEKRQQTTDNPSREDQTPLLSPKTDDSHLTYEEPKTNPKRSDATSQQTAKTSRTAPARAHDQNVNHSVSETTVTADGQVSTKYEYSPEEPATEAEQFFIPTAFTPNGDGLNDLFLVKANFEPKSFEMTVLNRGGEMMFISRDINIGWDGQLRGRLMPQGVYVCIIKYKDSQGNEHKQQGQVLLIP